MAASSCPKCDGKFFEMAELTPARSNFEYMAIQCAKCGTVVGVTEFFNNGAQLHKLQEAVKKMARHAGVSVDL